MKTIFLVIYFLLHPHFAYGDKVPNKILDDVKKGGAVLVDVREEAELDQGILQDSFWLPTSSIKERNNRYEQFMTSLKKEVTIYTYCASGGRAGHFTEALEKKGFRSINLGGFQDLKSKGFPTGKHEKQ